MNPNDSGEEHVAVTRRLLTISQAAKELGISVQTLRAYADTGRVPSVKLPSGHRRFMVDEIRRLLHEWSGKNGKVPSRTDDIGGLDE